MPGRSILFWGLSTFAWVSIDMGSKVWHSCVPSSCDRWQSIVFCGVLIFGGHMLHNRCTTAVQLDQATAKRLRDFHGHCCIGRPISDLRVTPNSLRGAVLCYTSAQPDDAICGLPSRFQSCANCKLSSQQWHLHWTNQQAARMTRRCTIVVSESPHAQGIHIRGRVKVAAGNGPS